ncbi:MAG: DNA polymerase III subunit [Planctomycetota bacterium]|jgi:DNA polymerase III delta' subunit
MWSEAAGQVAARRAVGRALASDRMPSALLVTGEPGLGKRAFAEWVAAARWCEAADAPCASCRTCRQVASGNHPDLLVIARDPDDAEGLGSKHEITVDQIRKRLIPALGLRPVQASGHIVVIDGADTLNESAQNALLKTLEEPPAGSLLLLLCAHPEALLETVRSRCQLVRLAPLDPGAMRALHPDADEEVLALAAGRPGRVEALLGVDVVSLRDALDQVLAGRMSGSAFALGVQAVVDAAKGEARDAGADAHRLAVEVLLRRVLDRAAACQDPDVPWGRVEAALYEVGADLHRHIPPAVAWGAAGQALASVSITDLVD